MREQIDAFWSELWDRFIEADSVVSKSAPPPEYDIQSWAEYEAKRQFPCGWDERDAKV